MAAEFTVLFFASLADRAGVRRFTMALEPADTIATIRDRLSARFPAIAPILPRVLFALDEEYADAATIVPAGATLALIPPVSGG